MAVLTVEEPVRAANDLLVAPTRLVLDERTRASEVILNNIGEKAATYRVSLELRRMTTGGLLVDVETPEVKEAQALELLSYAPRRVTLAPNQPQAIRVAVRKPADLPDGEYRVHMLFRATPDATPVAAATDAPSSGFSIQLTPIYGITIPVIIRSGQLDATAGIGEVKLSRENGEAGVAIQLSRAGTRSTFGELRVLKPGRAAPIASARGVAVYTEVDMRQVVLPLADDVKGPVAGPVLVQYVEPGERGERVIAESRVTLP